MSEHYGATAVEWATFDIFFGLTEDLLPVVSNPNAEISHLSKMEQKGKVPSHYNAHGKIAGLPKWPAHRSKPQEIITWSKEPDYGICIQTRFVRAIDIDVARSAPILNFIWSLGYRFPVRQRSNSGKCLLPLRLPGTYAKRVVRVEGGIIEFLADGQQFVAAGTHPSGVRYEWLWDEPDFPTLEPAEFEALWSAIAERFGTSESVTKGTRRQGEDSGVHDPVLDKLDVLGWGPQGQAHIECPFKAEHTADTGESSTSYFPAGTKGYEQGHFVCLHAHCAQRGDEEFLDALGLRAAEFEVETLPAPLPAFKRTTAGEVHATVANLFQALRRDDVCSSRIAYDAFQDEVVITSAKKDMTEWRLLTDNDYTLLQLHLERNIGFKPIQLDLLRRSVWAVAFENTFDSAQAWLKGLSWDGKARVERFMAQYVQAEDSSYTRAMSCYIWTALAGRVMQPGVKADMVPVWESGQGRGKSWSISALAPNPDFYMVVDLNEKEADLARKMRGKLIGEIEELRGLQTRDLQSINAFVTRQREEWIPKYSEKSKRFARRLIFIGTTNEKQIFAADETGYRRWLPTRVGFVDVEAIRRDRDQLWAEGREMFMNKGVMWKEAEKLAPKEHEGYVLHHPWKEIIALWLETPEDIDGKLPTAKGYVTTAEIMRDALHLETANLKGTYSKEIAKAMRGCGFERKKPWTGKKTEWVWVPLDLAS